MFSSIKKIHFVGIGGIGMSGIAEILLDQGFKISGSDMHATDVTDHLKSLGATIYQGHAAENLDEADVLVYSSAVKPNENPEVLAAVEKKIPVIRRAEMLAELTRMKYSVSIAGTHGKTTTTSMTGLVMMEGNLDPTVIVGGKLSGLGGTNARLGHGEWSVIEADEFDRSFLQLFPTVAVITTLEREHLDIYSDIDDIKNAFVEFANKVPFYGFVVLCLDEPALTDILPRVKKRIITYGLTPQCDLYATDLHHQEKVSVFTVVKQGVELGQMQLRIPGVHNIKNALAATAVGLELGVPFEKIASALAKFTGVYRRFEVKADVNGVMVVDDYAHHPTEVKATLEGIRAGWKRRIVAVFQPHTYSRTRDFYMDFGKSFFNADVLIVTDVYPAREQPIQGVTGELIANAAIQFGHRNVHYVQDKAQVPAYLQRIVKPGDIVVTMGAGDIWKYGMEFIGEFKA
ncbi:MAG TPA: UDP-N-acetylmuramate--L-alanine ligase [Candidatus Kapabacteria bacterium]|nr:UDP-N-acetylmuramate--L-alanine ligase [Candidatus Kapabacteria bacterium]